MNIPKLIQTLFLTFNLLPPLTCKLYLPNIYDPLLPVFKEKAKSTKSTTTELDLTTILEDKEKLKDLYNKHNQFTSELSYGDFRIISWTAEGKELKQDVDDLIENIESLLEISHPTIISLQAIKSRILEELKQNIIEKKLHYTVILDDISSINSKNGGKSFVPIIFDNLILKLKESGFLNQSDKTGPTISYAIFDYLLPAPSTSPNNLTNKTFAVINMDLFQSDPKIVNVKYFTMLQKIKTHKSLSKISSLFLMGGIGNADKHIKNSLKEYTDLIDRDVNNQNLSNTTVHGGNNNNDNIKRHYILLKDTDRVFQLNTARILSGLKVGFNYPLEVTMSFRREK
ncbi:hypothetical protein CDIK_2776 [Cucumispora dikerogammari]|nr:hypothetical protein CDIK_2776 [Cucumispora dikerogammari]